MGDRRSGPGQPTEGAPRPPTVTVPASAAGVAAGLSVLAAGLATVGPERSHPAYRSHPPLLEVGDALDVPPTVRSYAPRPDITVVVPDDLAALFVAAPLSYYLGATVEVDGGGDDSLDETDDTDGDEQADGSVEAAPRLVGPDFTHEFEPLPAFQQEVAGVLQRTLLLDSLVRDVPGESTPCAASARHSFGGSVESLRGASPSQRLRVALAAEPADLCRYLPDWHLAAYVDPTFENVSSLPHLLEDLAVVYLPRAQPLDERGMLRRALDDFYRAPDGPIANVDVIDPSFEHADLHAWVADGVPVEAFTPTPAAYENRLRRGTADAPLDVAVVLNDPSMYAEHDEVGRIYGDSDQCVDVSVREHLESATLARTFEQAYDFVHFIGHCEEGGLRCPDGLLDVESLDEVGARTFFLNACGSYYQGQALVDRGSVAGAVTLRGVLNEPAARVGTTFARLLIAGCCIGRALSLARRRITMSTDYVAVGDGTYALATDESPIASLERVDGGYRVEYTVPATRHVGGYFTDPFDGCDRLRGTTASTVVRPGDLPATLAYLDCPVIHDGALRWASELARILGRR